MSSPDGFDDLPPSIQWWYIVAHFGSTEMFIAKVLWLHYRAEATPARVAAVTEALERELARQGIEMPSDENIAALRAYWDNGNKWPSEATR